MSDTQHPQPWLGAFSSAPPAQHVAETHAPSDITKLMNPAPPAKRARGYHRFELPESVIHSMHWKGCDADRFFGMWEPTAGEIRKLVKSNADFSDGAQNFIAAIGIPVHGTGVILRGDGNVPMLADVSDNTSQVLPWWERLTPKAQTMITSMFVEFIMPTAEEGESLRASRQWVEG